MNNKCLMLDSHVDDDGEEVVVTAPPKKGKAKRAPQPRKAKAKVARAKATKTKAPLLKKVETQSDISAVEILEPKITPLKSRKKPKSVPEVQPIDVSELDDSIEVMVLLVIYN